MSELTHFPKTRRLTSETRKGPLGALSRLVLGTVLLTLLVGCTGADATSETRSMTTVCYQGTDRCIQVVQSVGEHTLTATEVEMVPGLGFAAVQIDLNQDGICALGRLAVDPAFAPEQQDALIAEKEVGATLQACQELTSQDIFRQLSHDGQIAVIDAGAAIIAAQESETFVEHSGLSQVALEELRKVNRPINLKDCLAQHAVNQFSSLGYTIPLPPQDASLLQRSGCTLP